jgi:hypothetical protein
MPIFVHAFPVAGLENYPIGIRFSTDVYGEFALPVPGKRVKAELRDLLDEEQIIGGFQLANPLLDFVVQILLVFETSTLFAVLFQTVREEFNLHYSRYCILGNTFGKMLVWGKIIRMYY